MLWFETPDCIENWHRNNRTAMSRMEGGEDAVTLVKTKRGTRPSLELSKMFHCMNDN